MCSAMLTTSRPPSRAAPRWATPRSPDRPTVGPAVARLAEARLGRSLLPWQRQLVDVAGELNDDGTWTYDQIVVIVGRRAGKTVMAFAPALRRALLGPIRLPDGRTVPFRGSHTAQNLVAAQKRFLEDCAVPFTSSLGAQRRAAKVLRNLASTTLCVDTIRGRYPESQLASQIQVYAPTGGGIRGTGSAHITLDEALSFSVEAGRDLMTAIRPTLADYKGRGQLWILSNVGARGGPWLAELAAKGRAAVDAGRRSGICYVEYSAGDAADVDPTDEALWWQHHPGLGWTCRPDELRRDLEELGPADFAAEYLGVWPVLLAAAAAAALEPGQWAAAAAADAVLPDTPSGLYAAVDQDPDRTIAVACVAAADDRGRVVVEVAREWQRPTQAALVDWTTAVHAAHPLAGVALDRRTCASLADALTAAGVPVVLVDGARAAQAYADVLTVIAERRLAHGGDPLLDRHWAAAVRRPFGDGAWTLSRSRSGAPIAGAVASAAAVSLACSPPPPDWYVY